MMIVSHFLVFLYIASFFLGIVSFCVVTLYPRDVSRIYGIEIRELQRFLLLLFLFFLINFLIYYKVIIIADSAKYVLVVFFDILLVLTIYFCARLNHAEIFPYMSRLILPVGGVYVVVWGTTYFLESIPIMVEGTIRLVADSILFSMTIGYMVLLSAYQEQHNNDKGEARYLISINVMVVIYSAALYAEDLYFELSKAYLPDSAVYPYRLDPVFLFYNAVNIFTLFYMLSGIRKSHAIPSVLSKEQKTADAFEKLLAAYNISTREREVIDQIRQGMSNAQIAETLSISIYTVKRHVNNIFRKLEVKNRAELLRKIQDNRMPGSEDDA